MRAAIDYLRNRPFALLNLLFLLLIIEYIALGKYSFIQNHDFADDIFPRYIALWKNFAESGFQAWSSDIGAGTDRLTNLVYYDNLLSLLIAVLPAWLAYQGYILLTTYAGVFGFYKVSTRYFDHPPALAALTALFVPLIISYANSTGLSAGIQFYPFAIYLVYWIDSRFRSALARLFLIIAAIYVTSLAISFTLAFVYLGPFMLLWFVILGRVKPGTVVSLAVAFLVAAVIHHENVLALVSNTSQSHRIEFSELMTNEGRNYFIYQIVPALLVAFFLIRHRIGDVRLLLICGVFLLTTIGDVVMNYAWDAVLGRTVLGSLKISRLAFFSTSLLGLALVWIASRVGEKEKKALAVILALNFIAVAGDLKIANILEWAKHGNYVASFESKPLKDLRANDPSVFRVAIVEGVVHANMLAAYGLESASGYSPMYPVAYKHYWARVISPLLNREKDYREYFLDWGSRFYLFTGEPAGGGRYGVLKFRDFFDLDLLSLANVKYIISHQPVIDERLQLVSAGANSMALGNLDKLKLRLKENFLGRESLFVYRNPRYAERAFAVSKIRYFESEKELLDYASTASIDEMKSSAFVLQGLKGKLGRYDIEQSKASISIADYSPERIDFLVRSSGDALVVLTESANLQWKCASNGKELETFDAYGAFFSVVVGKGESSVSCRYRPERAGILGFRS